MTDEIYNVKKAVNSAGVPPTPPEAHPQAVQQQEVWFSLKLKGCLNIEKDASRSALELLESVQNFLRENTGDHGFEIMQQGEVIKIEEEADIYSNN